MKKQQKGPGKKDDKNKATSLELRKERDAEIMRQKQLKKQADAAAATGGACGGK